MSDQPADVEIAKREMLCPVCHGGYLHHGLVTVFDVEKEGAQTSIRTRVASGGKAVTDEVPNNWANNKKSGFNPSPRRDGVAIEFACETCGIFELTFAQHKGTTAIEWRRIADMGANAAIRRKDPP